MDFTEAEKREWHAARRRARATDEDDGESSSPFCSNCGSPFHNGVTTAEIDFCDVCIGN
jgi:hypothetical protein